MSEPRTEWDDLYLSANTKREARIAVARASYNKALAAAEMQFATDLSRTIVDRLEERREATP